MPRLLFSLLLLFTIHYSLFTPSALAQAPPPPCINGPWFNQSTCQFADKVQQAPESEIFGERYTFAQINWIINSLVLTFNPFLGFSENQLQDVKDSISVFLQAQGPSSPPFAQLSGLGAPGIFAFAATEIYSSRPASGILSINDTLAKFDLATPIHAQGYGYSATTGIQPLWRATRNLSYLVMIILLIIAGFMIMFRVKINPQTAVTLQLMVPKIIFTLLGITFSYAIAGLVIDLVYVLLALVLALMSSPTVGVFNPSPNTVVDVIRYFSTPDFGKFTLYYLWVWISVLVVNPLVTAIAAGSSAALSLFVPFVGALLGIFIIALAIFFFFLLIKIWWMMLKTYLHLIFLIIIGPIYILFGLLPTGNFLGFSSWFRQVIAHASVFLIVPLMFVLNIILWAPLIQDRIGILPGNPLGSVTSTAGGYPDFPLFGGKGWLTGFALGYAILALIPKTAEMIKESLKVPAFKYGTAFGEALGPAIPYGGQLLSRRVGPTQLELEAKQNAAKLASYTGAAMTDYEAALKRQSWAENTKKQSEQVPKRVTS